MIKSIGLIASAIFLTSLSSCSLLGSVLKLPASVLRTVGRTVGVSGLTDEAPAPIDESTTIEAPVNPMPAPPAAKPATEPTAE